MTIPVVTTATEPRIPPVLVKKLEPLRGSDRASRVPAPGAFPPAAAPVD